MIEGPIVAGQIVKHVTTGDQFIVVGVGLMKTDVHVWQRGVTYKLSVPKENFADIFTREESDFRLNFEDWQQ